MENKYYYTEAALKAIEKDRDQFEEMLKHIYESPFQNDCGDVWVTKSLAEAVCSELLYMCMDEKLSGYHDFKDLADRDDDELLHIYG